MAAEWVENDGLLLLLDGLDEVATEHRDACVNAINTYRDEHGFVDMVVCSRTMDYDSLTNQLKLNGAVVLQPLIDEQVDAYLATLGAEMDTVRSVLAKDEQLRAIGRSPLMLSVMALAYRGMSAEELVQFDTLDMQRNHLFEVYVQRMFERHIGEESYTQHETMRYLSWLASKMVENGQSAFFIEGLQPAWLTSDRQRWIYYVGVGTLVGAVFGFILGVIGLGRPDKVSGLVVAIAFGILAGLISTLFTMRGRIAVIEALRWAWLRTGIGFGVGIFGGIMIVIWLEGGPASRLGIPAGLAATGAFVGGLTGTEVDIRTRPNQGIWRSINNALRLGVVISLIVLLAFVVSESVVYGVKLDSILRGGNSLLFFVAITGMIAALVSGGFAAFQHVILRRILQREGAIPQNYAHFLDYCASLILLRKIGGGYIFLHRYLLEYFATLNKNTQ